MYIWYCVPKIIRAKHDKILLYANILPLLMIHVLTIHWKSDQWIDIQLKYLKHFISEPFRVYAFLNHVPQTKKHMKKYYYCSNENIKQHAIKLNILADIACFAADDEEDYLMFLDGDAFPISDITEFRERVMGDSPLAAIQRLDNCGDIQPHPCFCITKIKFWKQIQGDWKPGNTTWINNNGQKVADVGGTMLSKLNKNNVSWYKLNRSNVHSYHPVLFGVYDHLIYHHGAGFRTPGIRTDQKVIKLYSIRLGLFKFFKKIIPFQLARKWFFPLNTTIKINQAKSNEVYKSIENDFNFYEKL